MEEFSVKKIFIVLLLLITFLLTGYSLINKKANSGFIPSMLVIMYDDAAEEDYRIAFPVHKYYGVPGVVCANSSNLNTPRNLTVKQLIEMQDEGWEVVNHGKYHAGLDDKEVVKSINAGDTGIYVKLPYRLKKNYKYRLYNKVTGQEENVEISSIYPNKKDKKIGYVILKNGVEHSYPRRGTYLRLTYDSAVEEVAAGKKELENLGFNVTNYTYSYNTYAAWSKEIVSQYHNASRSNSGGKKLLQRINKKPLNRYALYSTNFETDRISANQINSLLTKTAHQGGITILWAHSWSDTFTEERLKYIIELALEKNIKIVTLEEALNQLE